MKIGFFGDSFCARGQEQWNISWPWVATKYLNKEIKPFCLQGTHPYLAYKRLQKHISEVDFVVFVISCPYRFPNDIDLPAASYGFAEEDFKKLFPGKSEDMHTMINMYYRLYGEEWHELGTNKVLEKVDNLFKEHNKPALVIPAFEHSLSGYKFKNATYTEEALRGFWKTCDRMMAVNRNYNQITKTPTYVNHFGPETNYYLGMVVGRIIKRIQTDPEFKKFEWAKLFIHEDESNEIPINDLKKEYYEILNHYREKIGFKKFEY